MSAPIPSGPPRTRRTIARLFVALCVLAALVAAVALVARSQVVPPTDVTGHNSTTLVLSVLEQDTGTYYSAELYRSGELQASIGKDTRERMYDLYAPPDLPSRGDDKQARDFVRDHMEARGFKWSWKPE